MNKEGCGILFLVTSILYIILGLFGIFGNAYQIICFSLIALFIICIFIIYISNYIKYKRAKKRIFKIKNNFPNAYNEFECQYKKKL